MLIMWNRKLWGPMGWRLSSSVLLMQDSCLFITLVGRKHSFFRRICRMEKTENLFSSSCSRFLIAIRSEKSPMRNRIAGENRITREAMILEMKRTKQRLLGKKFLRSLGEICSCTILYFVSICMQPLVSELDLGLGLKRPDTHNNLVFTEQRLKRT